MSFSLEPARSYDFGTWLWALGELPHQAADYASFDFNAKTVEFAWNHIDADYNKHIEQQIEEELRKLNELEDPLIVFADGSMGFKRDCTAYELENSDWWLASEAEAAAYRAEAEAYYDLEHLAYLDDLARRVDA